MTTPPRLTAEREASARKAAQQDDYDWGWASFFIRDLFATLDAVRAERDQVVAMMAKDDEVINQLTYDLAVARTPTDEMVERAGKVIGDNRLTTMSTETLARRALTAALGAQATTATGGMIERVRDRLDALDVALVGTPDADDVQAARELVAMIRAELRSATHQRAAGAV